MNKQTMKKMLFCATSMVATLCLCICVILSGVDVTPVAAFDSTTTTTFAAVDYATKLDYDTSPMRVGETRAVRFYHPVSGTATSGQMDSISPLLAVSYEDGSDTVYVTALGVGEASLYIRETDCAFGAYARFTITDDPQTTATTTTVHCFSTTENTTTTTQWYQATSSPGPRPYPEDINYDNLVNMLDVLELYETVATVGQNNWTWEGPLGDMNADNTVNMMDVLLLYAHVAGDYTFAV